MTAAATIAMPLSLYADEQAEATPAAWLIPGDDPALWLAEIATWDVPLDGLRLLVIPRSHNNPRPAGVLVIRDDTDAAKHPTTSAIALAYIKIANRLYVPAETRLRPAVGEDELASLLVWDVQALHPTIGLVGCRAEELHRVADLLIAPSPLSSDWSRANAGVTAEARVRSVRPARPPEVGQFLSESADDIGGEQPTELPPLPEESAASKVKAKSSLAALGMMDWLLKRLPGGNRKAASGQSARQAAGQAGAGGEGLVQRMQNWITSKQQLWKDGLDRARQRELARLMRMLETQPDVGLRFALPLNSPASYRGVAPPGGRLTSRDTNFSLGSLFGSAPADPWQLQHEMQQRLTAKYRELASRELALGRFRRAAYVFAHLLGDLTSAANALKQGRFYREAAALYRDQLKNPHLAAQCLEGGGLLDEAAEIYLSLKLYEQAGDLYRRLQQDEPATNAYRAAVGEHQARRDVVGAARILEGKLDARNEAREVLWNEWPGGPQATIALREYFWLLSRAHENDVAAAQISALTRDTKAAAEIRALASVLAELSVNYPSDAVRTMAQDSTRVVVGRRLAELARFPGESAETRELVNRVNNSTRDDRLLARDGVRYVDALLAKKPKPALPPRRPQNTKPARIAMTHGFGIGERATWQTAIARGGAVYAQGLGYDGRIVVARVSWVDTIQTTSVPRRVWDENARFRLALGPIDRQAGSARAVRHLLVIPIRDTIRAKAGTHLELAADGAFFDDLKVNIDPEFLPRTPIYDACMDEDDRLWVVHEDDASDYLVLSTFSRSGNLERSVTLTLPAPARESVLTIRLAVVGGYTCITYDQDMVVIPHRVDGAMSTIQFGRAVTGLIASSPHTRPRVGVAFADGACVCWPQDQQVSRFATDFSQPTLGMTANGIVVAGEAKHVAAYRVNGFEISPLAAERGLPPMPPIAILPAPADGSFALLFPSGHLMTMRCLDP